MFTRSLFLGNELSRGGGGGGRRGSGDNGNGGGDKGGGEQLRERQSEILKSRRMIYTLKPVGKLEGHAGCVNSVSFSREEGGSHVVTGSDDCSVKVWDVHSAKCLRTLYGPTSNVFATHFVPGKGDAEIVAAGNDGDIWHYDVNRDSAMRYSIHSRKVLAITFCPGMPSVFLSGSGDGTVRMLDLRMKYDTSLTSYRRIRDMQPYNEDLEDLDVVPQMLGGGHFQPIDSIQSQLNAALCVTYRDSSFANGANSTLVLNYRRSLGLPAVPALYSVEFHPFDPYTFIVASDGDGNVRRFDMRYIREARPASYTNIYRNTNGRGGGGGVVTGCTYSAHGDLVAASYLDHGYIYCYDADAHYPDAWYGRYVRREARVPKKRLTKYNPRDDYVPVFDEYSGELRDENVQERILRLMLAGEVEYKEERRPRKRRALDWAESPLPRACKLCGKTHSGLSLRCKDCGTVMCVECYVHEMESPEHKLAHNNIHIVQPLEYEGGTSEESIEFFHVSYLSKRKYTDDQLENIKNIIRADMSASLYCESRKLSLMEPEILRDDYDDEEEKKEEKEKEEEDDDDNDDDDDDDEIREDEEVDDEIESKNARKRRKTYYKAYSGHTSECTSKNCTFLGPNSEYLASGSDDHKIYIWDRESGDLVYTLNYHKDIVNSVTPQGCGGTILASAGLENYVCLWDSVGEVPTQDEIDENLESESTSACLDSEACSVQ